MVFNLSLRMLGTFPDAEDATQDILLKLMTPLSSLKKQSAFSTWVFSIAANHLKNYRKHMFARYPLNFEYYGNDIENGGIPSGLLRRVWRRKVQVQGQSQLCHSKPIDDLSQSFSFCKTFETPERTRQFISDFLNTMQFSTVKNS